MDGHVRFRSICCATTRLSHLFRNARWQATVVLLASLVLALDRDAWAASFSVTNGNDSGAGSLRQAILDANAAGAGPHTITVDNAVNAINITQNLPIIDTSVTVEGNTTTITGNNNRLFFVNSGNVALNNMDITGGRAQGGAGANGSGGGGGGLGAGGGLFINSGANVTIQGVTFDGNSSVGGNGGSVNALFGGGGGGGIAGTGGDGGNGIGVGGGGGGGGVSGTGGAGGTGGGGGGGGTSDGSAGGILTGGAGGGDGGNGGDIGNSGSAGSTNGGGGGGGLLGGGGGGGDFGGGGGAGLGLTAGNGGTGGFGAGGGGTTATGTAGAGGFGGGAGGATTAGEGGDALGGAIFVRQGGTLTVVDSNATANNTVTGGTGATTGLAAASNLYLMTGVNATFQGSGTSEFAGDISGDGGIIKQGTGTLSLTGVNAQTGGTTVLGGTLNGTTDSLQGDISNSGNVEFDQTTDGTYNGVISGTGGVTKDGSGDVTFSGANTYSGGTTVSGGTLTGTTTSLQGNIANNANVTFSQSTNGTYSGAMSGTGGLTKAGTGTVSLGGANTYSGGTTVSAGTLQGNTTSLQGDIANNAQLQFNQSTSGTYSGVVSGTGGVTKSGAGNVTFSGANTYSGGTTVSAGTLTGTTTSLQGNIANNANVVFSQNTIGTYTGAMAGTGALTKSGTGTVTLSGLNTYSGGTTVSGGTLQGTTTSLQGNITNNAKLQFDQSTDGAYSGAIIGTGGVIKSGTGDVTVSGANNYTGGTTVSGGTLTGTTISLQGNITNNAMVEFDQSTDGAYRGVIRGTGRVIKDGSGDVTFSGTNTYSGGTTVSGGTLTGTTTSLQGNITNNASVDFNQATSGIYSGVMSGTGSVTKDGTGAVTFSGANTYSGPTQINAGALYVNGSISSDTTVAAAATLGGNGTINGDVINSGQIAPGTSGSIGTLQINGDLTANAGSGLRIQINDGGTTPGTNNDLLAVNGDVTLDGTVHVTAATGSYVPGTIYTFLTYTGSSTGTFDGIDENLPLLEFDLIYGSGEVQFQVFRNAITISSLANTPNQLQIAQYLDDHSPMATGNFAAVLDSLDGQTNAGLRSALNQMVGQVYGTVSQLGVQNTTQVYLLLNRRLRWQHTDVNGDSFADDEQRGPTSPTIVLASYEPTSHESPIAPCENCSPWEGWITGYGLGGDVAGDGNASGGIYGIGGTVFAFQRWLNENNALGFFGAYSGFNLALSDVIQSTSANDFQFGGYLRTSDGFNYYLLAGAIGFDTYHAARQTIFDGINSTAQSDSNGWQASTWLERGLQLKLGPWNIQPFAALQYIYLRQNHFTETGANALDLQVDGVNTNALRSALGIYAARPINYGSARTLIPELRALWLHEFLEPESSFNSVLAGTGGASFVTSGVNYGRDWAVVGGGVNWKLNDGLTLFADYDLQINAVEAFHLGSGGMQYVW